MKSGYCINFNGIQNDTCAAEMVYQSVARDMNAEELDRFSRYASGPKERYAIARRVPCCVHNTGTMFCPKFRLPTREELEQSEAKIDAFVAQFSERLTVVRPAIEADISTNGNQDKSVGGVIDCPICGTGQVRYRYAGNYNGHIGAKCTTPDCIEWQE